ncbi:alpha/beta hydrolase [Lacihabitans soyangensis]|uniref:Esterase family protein n=1 Tax=Lacihabitans soyangensis TaxID=869394 RepID=A0AAE3H239_9BACT|nr:alpha/beta hydrolase-fold protein [Lacihabitans soyangensis]MCP9762875.1 esterase family protein [Lacihabitans soyangensis]
MSTFFTTEIANFQGLEFITVKSNALKKRADITVFNPSKNNIEAKSLPIVILLHGVYGSHWAWAMKGKVHETAQRLIAERKIKPMVLVMPSDGLFGDGSGYVPHKTENYEKWIAEDVIEVVKEQILQVDDGSPIYIAGLSMGGFGALRFGAKYPKIFKAFSGLSSITDFEQLEKFVSDFESLKDAATEQDGVMDWMIKNKASLPPFRFDCGTNDILIEHNRKLHLELKTHDIPHIYEEYPGEHSWDYWEKHIAETLIFFDSQI